MKTHVLLLAPVVVPLLGAVCFLLATLRPRLCWPLTAWVSPACAAVSLGAAIELAVTRSGHGPVTALGGLVRADSLSEFMLIVIGAVGLLATAASPAWLNAEIAARRASARAAAKHSALVQLFLAAMAAAVLAASLGLVWVAIEGTTIVTAFLVGQRKTRQAVEAAWKGSDSEKTSSGAVAPSASFGSRPTACRKGGPPRTSTRLARKPIHKA